MRIIWMADTKEVIRGFSKEAREDLGFNLFRLEEGLTPLDSKPIKTVGSGVYEIRTKDAAKQYRVIYATKVKGYIYVLHCFVKKAQKTSKHDIELARQRYKQISIIG